MWRRFHWPHPAPHHTSSRRKFAGIARAKQRAKERGEQFRELAAIQCSAFFGVSASESATHLRSRRRYARRPAKRACAVSARRMRLSKSTGPSLDAVIGLEPTQPSLGFPHGTLRRWRRRAIRSRSPARTPRTLLPKSELLTHSTFASASILRRPRASSRPWPAPALTPQPTSPPINSLSPVPRDSLRTLICRLGLASFGRMVANARRRARAYELIETNDTNRRQDGRRLVGEIEITDQPPSKEAIFPGRD
jgi:hypothetical protein